MPQMSPMLWLSLMNFSLMNLMMISIIIYFYWYPFTMSCLKTSVKSMKFKFFLKW